MALPVITNCYRCSIVATAGTETMVNVIHCNNSGSGDQSANVAADLGSAWKVLMQTTGLFKSQYHADHITVQKLDGATPSVDVIPSGWPFNGQVSTGNPPPSQNCIIFTLKTAHSGRSFRGRIFVAMPDPASLDTSGTKWNAATLPSYQTAATQLLTNMNPAAGHGSLIGVASYKLASFNSLTSILVRPYLGTQRRRAD